MNGEWRRLVGALLATIGSGAIAGGLVSALVAGDATRTVVSTLVVAIGVLAIVVGSRLQDQRSRAMRTAGTIQLPGSDVAIRVRERSALPVTRRPVGDISRPRGSAGTLHTSIPHPEWAVPYTKVSGSQTGGMFDPYLATGRVVIDDCELTDVSFQGLRLVSLSFEAGRFTRCDFRRLHVESVPWFGPGVFVDCRFDGMDLRRAGFEYTRFERCTFDGAKIDWICHTAEFIDCHFAGPIKSAVFYGRPPDAVARAGSSGRLHRALNEFRGNDFRDAVLIDFGLRGGIDVGAQLWPSGAEYVRLDRIQERARRLRTILELKPGSADRDVMIRWLDSMIRDGQSEIIERRRNPYLKEKRHHALLEQFWDMLAKS